MSHGTFPNTRLRPTRQADWIRWLVRETRLAPEQLIQPLFVAEGALCGPVKSMPGVARLSLVELQREVKALRTLGISAVALFPVIPTAKRKSHGR